jgi:hypothetical protein
MIASRLALLLASLALGACGRAGGDPARQTLDDLVAAAEARDADRLAARLSDAFRGPGGMVKAEAIATVRRHVAAYESVGLTLHEVEIERRSGGATARCLVEFSGRAREAFGLGGLLPSAAVYRFELQLADEGGTWRVEQATWETVTPRES